MSRMTLLFLIVFGMTFSCSPPQIEVKLKPEQARQITYSDEDNVLYVELSDNRWFEFYDLNGNRAFDQNDYGFEFTRYDGIIRKSSFGPESQAASTFFQECMHALRHRVL